MAKADRVSKTFGQQVKRTRERKGWTQDRLVAALEKLGEPMDRTTLARIEMGKRGVSVDDLMLFALALGVAPLYLLLPKATGPVELAAGVTVPGWEALAWARGMYALGLTDAPDTEGALAEPDVRFYYEETQDYQAEAIRHFPLLRDLWLEVGLAMSWAGTGAFKSPGGAHPLGRGPHLPRLRQSLEDILNTAALAIAHLDGTTKED